MKSKLILLAALLFTVTHATAEPAKVNALNFARAETDMYFARFLKQTGGLAKFHHIRVPTPIEKQDVVRMQRDTLYSSAVFDLDAGPVTITLPDAGKRFMSLLKDVPVDGFWSFTVYDAKGFMFENEQKAYSVNNVAAKRAADGSVKIRFGGDPKGADNYLAIQPGWNYVLRLYRPQKEILDGTWKAPDLQPVK